LLSNLRLRLGTRDTTWLAVIDPEAFRRVDGGCYDQAPWPATDLRTTVAMTR
jgi:hypothetical protein